MNILVCCKPISPKELNPLDAYALNAAAKIKSKNSAVHITALSMGAPDAIHTLRNAVAIAADDGVLVPLPKDFLVPEAFHSFEKSYTLSCAVKLLGTSDHPPDCIFFGAEAPELYSGHIPAMLAEHLDYPFIYSAISADAVSSETGQQQLLVQTEQDDYLATFNLLLPCVVSFTKTPETLGHPSIPGIIKSQHMEFSPLQIQPPNPSTGTQMLRSIPLRKNRDTQIIHEGDDSKNADRLIELLTETGIL